LYARLGETCGSAFWILLNQRLQLLRPDEEKYAAEIERSIYNVVLANQAGSAGFRYHTMLLGLKEPGTGINTCCEGQGTRLTATLPEFIYSIARDGVYVNLFAPSALEWTQSGSSMRLMMRTEFPLSGAVELEVESPRPRRAVLRIRMPSWAANSVALKVNNIEAVIGTPGTYVNLDRVWNTGDKISFVLPMALKLTRYTGADQVVTHERFALEYGPLLMAAVGAADAELLLFLANGRPADLLERLRPDKDNSCHFTLSGSLYPGSDIRFIPYFEVNDQSFSCFPLVTSRVGVF
jgi:DUF1680 family protein